MEDGTAETLLVGVTLKGEEIKRFKREQERRRDRSNAATGYALLLNGLDLAEQKQEQLKPVAA